MGLLELLASPVTGVIWIAEQLQQQAEAGFYDEDAVRGKLMELELQYDMGAITEEEYMEAEEALLARLKVIRERKSQGAA